jgi:intracellular septation protein
MTAATSAKGHGSPGLRLAIDYAPLLVFMLITFAAPDALVIKLVAASTHALDDMDRIKAIVIARVIVATGAFMLATVIAMIFSRLKLGSISPMLWISGALVLVFGGLTIWFHDPKFIQMKPTFVYAIFAGTLFTGIATGRPLLQQLLGAAYPGLSDLGWRKVTLNWALFFVAMAIGNEIARELLDLRWWTLYKFPGCAIITALFAFANVPMMMRHGLMSEDKTDTVIDELPPE